MIQHIFVVDNSGIPVFSRGITHYCPLGQHDAFAVSGLLTALKSFAKEIGVGDINSIGIAESKLLLQNEDKFFSTFRLEPLDRITDYEPNLMVFSNYLSSIYPDSAPIDEETRNIMINHIEKYLAESTILKRSNFISKIKLFLRRLLRQYFR